ncbi:DMT family transporter [Sinanaerobacter chloroacetimidivorans]|uniref:DMT family transporter n=1 Tax=Sinanaerobacter chloroacetimidivorans TaxID=2818044 RepID=A0A8J8B342_9FIRM|nr:DMT family transporter [Sinanaerobacter chloroacetimidivorans]MBR0599362.1 DMT family transporter [Sinanaerobacter chloroacetimidivorans]
MRNHTYGYIYAILAAFFFALIAIIGKGLVSGGTHPLQVTFYQYVFTILILGIWLSARKSSALRCNAKQLRSFALLGVIGGAGTNLLFYSALQYLDAGISSMLLFVHPVYITIFFAVTRIRTMKPLNYFSVLLAVSGAAIVLDIFSGALRLSPIGISLGILSGVSYAFYNIFADLKLKSEDPNIINFYACISAMIFTLVLLLFSGIGFTVDYKDLPSIFVLAGFSGILPVYFIFKALQYIGSEKVSVIASVELPMTLIMAFTFLGERMRPIQLFGVLLIIISTILLHYHEKEKNIEQ